MPLCSLPVVPLQQHFPSPCQEHPDPAWPEVTLCPPAASQGKQDGLGSLVPAAGGAQGGLCCAAHLTFPRIHTWLGPTAGQGMKVEVLGRRGRWDVWRLQQNRQKFVPQSHPCHHLHHPSLHHPCQGDTDPKGSPHPCCLPASPWGGQRSHHRILGCWCPSFVLVEQAWEAG